MSYWLYVFFICGFISGNISTTYGESQICGYSGDSFVCCSGYKKDDQGECIVPICEFDCGVGGRCIRPDTCYCPDGRVSSSCSDDSRQEGDGSVIRAETGATCMDNCNGQGVCVNGKCQCHTGYSGTACLEKLIGQCYLSLSRGICQKLDHEINVNIELCCGAFGVAWGDPCQKCPRSRCAKGYVEVDGICQDANECTIPELCRKGQCENSEGSYKCICTTGYQFDKTKGDCIKIKDVCQHLPSVCGRNMECLPLDGGKHLCKCIQGHVKANDLKSCVLKERNSINLCAMYGSFVCQHGRCKPDRNNYKCECNPGYRSSGDHKSCKKNIDYCSLYQNVLCPNGECVSVNDDYMCKCDAGYTPSFNRKKCTSVCDLYPTTLCPNAKCIPQAGGSYECHCNEGYSATGKGKQCRRIMNDQSASSINSISNNDNQASYEVDYCSYDYYKRQCQGGRCTNKKGYYQCECPHGYVSDKNGLACKKIEVDTPVSGQMRDMAGSIELKSYCDKYGSFLCTHGHCVESGSSYQCRCNSGYTESGDGKSCYDIDECASESKICVQGTCTNSPGSYQCSCYDGFTIHYVPGGPKCYDRNECDEDPMLCSNGQCTNKWGSYSCSCNSGYVVSKDGKQCDHLRSSADNKDSEVDNQCKNCRRSCKQINSTHHECECPPDLESVLSTGLCAPMPEVVDIQFDMPISSSTRQKRSSKKRKHILFELVPGSDKEAFLARVTSRYRTVTIKQCISVNEPGKDGILCTFDEGELT